MVDVKVYKELEKFMRESNAIEWEVLKSWRWVLNPWDMNAALLIFDLAKWDKALNILWVENPCSLTEDKILRLHSILWKHLRQSWVWKYRDIQVTVWNYKPPTAYEVPKLMSKFCKGLKNMDSFEAHNSFENIHPFQDLNGRVGRLIWLYKSLIEWKAFWLRFLHRYYYQTLEHNDNRKWRTK